MPSSKKLNLRIILENPPPGVLWGLQKGKGSDYETVQKQVSKSDNLVFEFSAEIKTGEGDTIDFSGPFVQGKCGERFVYLDVGTYAGQADSAWSRRLKIPLTGISEASIDDKEIMFLETKVPGTGKDGGPNCATVKPFNGWQPVKLS